MLLVKNGTVYLGNGRHEAGWDVLCDGPVIRAVSPNLSCEGAQVIDAAGRDVYPGFVLCLCGLGAVSFSEMWSDGMDLDESCVPLCPEMDIRDAFDLRELKLQRFGRVGITSYGLCPGIHAMLAGQIALVHVDGDHTADVFLAERIALKGNFTSNVKSTCKKARKAPQTRMAMHQMLEEAFRAAQEYMNKSEKDYDAGKEVLCRVLRREIPFLVSVEAQAEIESVVAVAKKYNLRLVLTGAYAAEHVAEDILKDGYSVMLGNSNYMQAGQRGHTDHRKLVELSRKGMKLSIFCSGDEAYARVSTDHEDQATSYGAQVDYYTSYIKSRDDWEFVAIYTDEGISATNTKKREGFKTMIADALAGKIDLIAVCNDMIYYNRVIKMAFRYKFSEEEIKETEQARKKNTDKRAEARLKALELRAKGAEARLSAFSEQL